MIRVTFFEAPSPQPFKPAARGADVPGMYVRLATALLAAALALGCSFVEELDNSSKMMDKYTAAGRASAEAKKKAAEEAAAKKAAGGGGVSDFFSSKGKGGKAAASAKETAGDWWQNATSLNTDERDPDLVRCQLPGKVEFMRKHDCLMRSGLALK